MALLTTIDSIRTTPISYRGTNMGIPEVTIATRGLIQGPNLGAFHHSCGGGNGVGVYEGTQRHTGGVEAKSYVEYFCGQYSGQERVV